MKSIESVRGIPRNAFTTGVAGVLAVKVFSGGVAHATFKSIDNKAIANLIRLFWPKIQTSPRLIKKTPPMVLFS